MTLQAIGLVVEAGGARLVDEVEVRVEPGRWLCLVGPNGAGKTTVLRCVAGLSAYQGQVLLDGAPLVGRPRERARRVAFVPQQPELPVDMSVLDYVLLGRLAHIPRFATESDADLEVVLGLCHRLDLAPLVARRIGTLSGGEVQRCLLARALAQEAPVLLLDEPTSALDVGHQQQVLELVDQLRRERCLTVLSTMHDLTLAGQYVDEVALLSRGRLVASGPPDTVITAEAMATHYGAHVDVQRQDDGAIVVIPRRRDTRGRPAGG